MRRRQALPLLVVVAGAIMLGWPRSDAATARVVRADLAIPVDISGTLASVESSQLGPPQVEGMYTFKIAMMAPEGTEVTRGQPVLAFDGSELQKQLEQALNDAESARKQIEKKEVDLRVRAADDALTVAEAEARLRKARLKAEWPPSVVASLELDKAALELELAEHDLELLRAEIAASARAGTAELAALRAELERAESDVGTLQRALARLRISAPRDGMVIYSSARGNSDKKKVGDSCWLNEKVLEIPDLSAMRGDGEVEEAHVGKVAVGQPVAFRLDAHPDIEYRGVVSSISTVVHERSRSDPLKVAEVTIALSETDTARMRPGMRFHGSVEVDRAEDALVCPATAVHPTADGPVVYRRSWTGVEPVPVELGRRTPDQVEIVSGLDEGTAVLVGSVGSAS